jgi:signal transduction histidine kinase
MGTQTMSTSSAKPSEPAALENPAPAKVPPSYPFSNWKVAALSAVAALLVFMIAAGMDWLVLHENQSRTIAISLSDSVAAVIAGVLVFRLLQYERDRRRRLRQRLEIIAEMNHHVRNALQVISLSTYSSADQKQLAAIKESVSRIQWALREILPKM